MADGYDALARIAELEGELRNARAQFDLAERAANVGYWRTTLPDFRTTWSAGLNAVLGLDPAALRCADLSSFPFGQSDEIRLLHKKIEAAVEMRLRLSERARIRCADGSERIIDVVGDLEFGPDGDPIAMIGATRDVTQLVLAETERCRIEQVYRILTEAASDIMIVHDLQGKVEFASASLERVLGWTKHEFEGDSVVGLVHPDDFPTVMELRRELAPGRFTTATYRLRHADGRYIWFETTMSVVRDDKTCYIVTVLRDVSERMAHELKLVAACEAAEAANRAKSAFLANMSHELRTPLNAIIGFADMMRHETFGPVGDLHYRDYVGSIHKSGQHLLDLINDILDVAKIEAGKFDLKIEEMDLAETLEECMRTMVERAAQGGISLKTVLPAESLACEADRRAIKQIILNLLSNAIKFTPTGGHVDVAARADGDLMRIEVRDTGIGVAAEDLPRLAKPFEQVCDDPFLAKSGTGLGLALVRALVEQHGGQLRIDSPGQNGTIVTVEFPRAAIRSGGASRARA